jgi:serine/threonine-protein kinase
MQKTIPRNERPMPMPAPAVPNFAASSGPNTKLLAGGAAFVLVAIAAVYLLFFRTGALTITVAGPGGRAVDDVHVLVDGVEKCDKSPCQIASLSPGAHLVKASAKGYQETADQAVSVGAGQQATANVTLAAAGMGTGVRVSALGSALKLYVDGQEIGELPETVKNLSPGDHDIKVGGNERYEPYEEHVKLDDGDMKTIGPLKLKVLKGLATFKAGAGAEGARVLLDTRLVPELPATIEVPAGKELTLLATKPGYAAYKRTVSFDDGIAEKTFEITMVEDTTGSSSGPVASTSSSSPSSSTQAVSRSSKAASSAVASATDHASPSKAAKSGKATLNMNSIPVSNVLLNGRPLGTTPKIGVQVDPGPQTVVFVHPTLGRKVMSGVVNAGESKTFMARLQ